MEPELDLRMAQLISSLTNRPGADDISDVDLVAEVEAVRGQSNQ